MRHLLPLGLLLTVGCSETEPSTDAPVDLDYDGFPADEDCDDTNPWIHPGGAETPGDGIDGDCDGRDGLHAYVGSYDLQLLAAGFSGFDLLVPGAEYGEMTIQEDLFAQLSIHAEVDPSIAPLILDIELEGEAVADPLPGTFSIVATGAWGGEEVYVSWICELAEPELLCTGELKILGYTFENTADFESAD